MNVFNSIVYEANGNSWTPKKHLKGVGRVTRLTTKAMSPSPRAAQDTHAGALSAKSQLNPMEDRLAQFYVLEKQNLYFGALSLAKTQAIDIFADIAAVNSMANLSGQVGGNRPLSPHSRSERASCEALGKRKGDRTFFYFFSRNLFKCRGSDEQSQADPSQF